LAVEQVAKAPTNGPSEHSLLAATLGDESLPGQVSASVVVEAALLVVRVVSGLGRGEDVDFVALDGLRLQEVPGSDRVA
jgi:hypothetical protein